MRFRPGFWIVASFGAALLLALGIEDASPLAAWAAGLGAGAYYFSSAGANRATVDVPPGHSITIANVTSRDESSNA